MRTYAHHHHHHQHHHHPQGFRLGCSAGCSGSASVQIIDMGAHCCQSTVVPPESSVSLETPGGSFAGVTPREFIPPREECCWCRLEFDTMDMFACLCPECQHRTCRLRAIEIYNRSYERVGFECRCHGPAPAPQSPDDVDVYSPEDSDSFMGTDVSSDSSLDPPEGYGLDGEAIDAGTEPGGGGGH